MKKAFLTLGTLLVLAFGAQATFAACPCQLSLPCAPSYTIIKPCCQEAAPCPACPVADPCSCQKCNSCCDNCCDNCHCCREKCRWWKFWQNKCCCDKCDNCCDKCNKCNDCCD